VAWWRYRKRRSANSGGISHNGLVESHDRAIYHLIKRIGMRWIITLDLILHIGVIRLVKS
jgi:hypothetical protein